MLGSEIRRLRNSKNMSQADLSKATGIPQTSISEIELNKYIPKITTCVSLAKALEVDLQTLLDSIEDNKAS